MERIHAATGAEVQDAVRGLSDEVARLSCSAHGVRTGRGEARLLRDGEGVHRPREVSDFRGWETWARHFVQGPRPRRESLAPGLPNAERCPSILGPLHWDEVFCLLVEV